MLTIIDGKISLTRGDTAYLTVDITNELGEEYAMQSGDTLTLSVKKRYIEPTYSFQAVATGSNTIKISPEDTKLLNFGEYVYDIQLNTETGDVYTIVPVNTFEITPEVTC